VSKAIGDLSLDVTIERNVKKLAILSELVNKIDEYSKKENAKLISLKNRVLL